MSEKNKYSKMMKLISLLVLSFNFYVSFGAFPNDNIGQVPKDTIISDPISVDSLFIVPAMPREGENITLWAATTHSSSPCGLLDYQVIFSATNTIYVAARYWEGLLTAICHSMDSMNIGKLKAGRYVLNFINRKEFEFTVYPKIDCHADYIYEYPKCETTAKCLNTIAFFDRSTGNILRWRWNFGDSTLAFTKNTVHIYKNPGIYNVCLTVVGVTTTSSQICEDTKCKSVPVPPSNCKAFFKYQIINEPSDTLGDSTVVPFPSFMVKFTDLSAGNVIQWSWDFGDGTSSPEQNPVHRFKEGIYLITLQIATKEGCESKYSERLILVDPQPVCRYTGTVKDYTGLDGCKYIIELDNGVKLEPVRVIPPFAFRDNQRVILAYRPLQVGSICMVGITAEITCIREIISPVCKAYFTYVKDSLVDCICYDFYDKSVGKVLNWFWNFGDGTTSNEQNPRHVFSTDSSSYFVCLTITTTDGCTDTYCEKVFIGGMFGLDKGLISGISNKLIYKVYSTITAQYFYADIYLEKASAVEVCVYNLLGNKVKQIEFKNVSTGMNQLKVDVGTLKTGQYIYMIKSTNLSARGTLQIYK